MIGLSVILLKNTHDTPLSLALLATFVYAKLRSHLTVMHQPTLMFLDNLAVGNPYITIYRKLCRITK